jgi:signal transduction histidine kinase
MSSAPGRRELRWFALAVALAGLFNLSNVGVTLRLPPPTIVMLSRLNLFLGGLHAAVWFKYSAAQEERALHRYERAFVAGGVLLSALALVPGLIVEEHLFVRDVAWLGVTYADAPPTRFGYFAFAYHGTGIVLLFVRYTTRLLRGDRKTLVQSIALGAILLGAAHDALAATGVIGGPYLLDAAMFVMMLAVGGSLTGSFVANARELDVSSRNLAMAHEALVKRERLAALGELAAVVAHEVRNPLAVVFNAISGLRKARLGSRDHDALLGIVQEEAERLRDIVSDLLEFAHPRPPHYIETAVEEVVRGAIDSARAQTGASEADVSLEVVGTMAPTSCDERLVRQAVINLVTNALQAAGRRSPVRVTLEPSAREPDDRTGARAGVVVRVADDGSGVPDELRDRVFTPFYSTRPSGTGLGLAVVKSSAEAHGGEVTLESTPGGGATFTLRLPRRPVSNRPRALERAS